MPGVRLADECFIFGVIVGVIVVALVGASSRAAVSASNFWYRRRITNTSVPILISGSKDMKRVDHKKAA